MKLHKCISLSSYYSSYKYFTDLTCELYVETRREKGEKMFILLLERVADERKKKEANDIQWHSAESFFDFSDANVVRLQGIRVEILLYANCLTSKVKEKC